MNEQNYPQKLYSTGEFTKICGLNKSTLFYYDKIGLLKPLFVDENGYRFYSNEQFFGPYIIDFLKNAGLTLEEIKQYLDNRTPEYFLSVVDTLEQNLERQRRDIERRTNVVKSIKRILSITAAETPGVPGVYEDDVEYRGVRTKMTGSNQDFLNSYYEAFSHHFEFCKNHLGISVYPLCYLVDPGYIKTNNLPDGISILTILAGDYDVPKERLLVRSPGKYIRELHIGNYYTLGAACRHLLNYLDENHIIPTSQIYVMEVKTFLSNEDSNNYTFSLTVRID